MVTEGVRDGGWVLLDNMGDADACVLERLNPVLEYPVDWRLVEKGDEEKMEVHPAFRLVGTNGLIPELVSLPAGPQNGNCFFAHNVLLLFAENLINPRLIFLVR